MATYCPGLVSISFRQLSPEEIIKIAKEAGLSVIEWGSDVHAPCNDVECLDAIKAAGDAAGVTCCSYGTYFRLGVTPLEELPVYIAAAKRLGTDILRLWCGNKSTAAYTDAEKAALFAVCKQAATLAEKEGVTLCLECHHHTFTEDPEGALQLMQAVDSPAFRMYWQPNQYRTQAENMAYAKAIAPYTTHLHVFNWEGDTHLPLKGGMDTWRRYLSNFEGNRMLLLEFMPQNTPEELLIEAAALRELIGGIR